MAETPSPQVERRCRSCGAVLYEGSAWCSMCFTPVEPPAAAAEPGTPAAAEPRTAPGGEPQEPGEDRPADVGGGVGSEPVERSTVLADAPARLAMWPCPVCDGRNPLALDACATCGTPFAAVMRQEPSRSQVDPRAAFRRSLLFPGLGHRLVGRDLDGFARGVLFGMLLLATVMLAFSGVSSGEVHALFLLYVATTVGMYLITALEAARLARGGELLVSSRILLWTTVAILLLTIVMVSFVIGTSVRR